jgi:hypothetical protein
MRIWRPSAKKGRPSHHARTVSADYTVTLRPSGVRSLRLDVVSRTGPRLSRRETWRATLRSRPAIVNGNSLPLVGSAMPLSSPQAYELSERQFERYRHASQVHRDAGADRAELGTTPADPSVEHLAAVGQADAILEVTLTELDAARAEYLFGSDPAE